VLLNQNPCVGSLLCVFGVYSFIGYVGVYVKSIFSYSWSKKFITISLLCVTSVHTGTFFLREYQYLYPHLRLFYCVNTCKLLTMFFFF